MNAFRRLLDDERGMVMAISLLILALLIGAGVGAIVSTQTDLKTSGNLLTGTQAFYLAEAGIEWGKKRVEDTAPNPPSPGTGTLRLSPGSFTVSFLSPTKVNNLQATVTIQSTGQAGSSSSTIQARVTKSYELSDAAVSLRGNEGHPSFVGNAFLVDGRDYDPVTGTLVPGAKASFGISVPDATLEAQVEGGLTSQQKDNITGKGGTIPNVEKSGFLPSEVMARLVDELCNDPGAHVVDMPTTGTLSVSGNTTWGTRVSPELRCIRGLGLQQGDKVDIRGNFTGVGVLVVSDADLEIGGAFHWEGLILVSGTHVGFRVEGGGNKDIFGSAMINERGWDTGAGTEEIKLQGAATVRYSRSALQRAAQLFPLTALETIYDSVPSAITQNYWRETIAE